MRRLWVLLCALALGCGGGGGAGGGGARLALTGRVVWVETGGAPSPPAEVEAGAASAQTDPADGFFQLDVPPGTSSAKVTYRPAGRPTVVQTFQFPAMGADLDAGELYIGPTTVAVEGRTLDEATGAAIVGATVTLAGRRATSGAGGRFRIERVAYAPTALTLFLGLLGQASAPGYFVRSWSPIAGPSAGVAQAGDLALTPEGSTDPPPPPFNVQGRVLPAADGASARVEVFRGTTRLRLTAADSQARYQVWLPVGSYQLKATKGTRVATRSFAVTDTSAIIRVDVTLP